MRQILIDFTLVCCSLLTLCSYAYTRQHHNNAAITGPAREALMPLCGTTSECLIMKLKLREIEKKHEKVRDSSKGFGRRHRHIRGARSNDQLSDSIFGQEQHRSFKWIRLYWLQIQRKMKETNNHRKQTSFNIKMVAGAYTKRFRTNDKDERPNNTPTIYGKAYVQSDILQEKKKPRRKSTIHENSQKQKRNISGNRPRQKRAIYENSPRQKRVINANYYNEGIGDDDFYDYDYEYDFAYDFTDSETVDEYYDEEIANQEQAIANSGFDEARVKSTSDDEEEADQRVIMETEDNYSNTAGSEEMPTGDKDKTKLHNKDSSLKKSHGKSKASHETKTAKGDHHKTKVSPGSHTAGVAKDVHKGSKSNKNAKSADTKDNKKTHKNKTSKDKNTAKASHKSKSPKHTKSKMSESEESEDEDTKEYDEEKSTKKSSSQKSHEKKTPTKHSKIKGSHKTSDTNNKSTTSHKSDDTKTESDSKKSHQNSDSNSKSRNTKKSKTTPTKSKSEKDKATEKKTSHKQVTNKKTPDDSVDESESDMDDNDDEDDSDDESADNNSAPDAGQIEHLLAKLNTLIGDIEESESSGGRGVVTMAKDIVHDEGNTTGSCSAFTHTTVASGFKGYVNYMSTRVVSALPYIIDGDESFLLHHLDKTMKDNNVKLSIELRSKSCHCMKGLNVKAVQIGGKHHAMLTKFTLEYFDGGWNYIHNQDGKMRLFSIPGTLSHDSFVPFHRRIYSTALRVFPQDWMRLPWVRVQPFDCG